MMPLIRSAKQSSGADTSKVHCGSDIEHPSDSQRPKKLPDGVTISLMRISRTSLTGVSHQPLT
jgi:hypothetical protein